MAELKELLELNDLEEVWKTSDEKPVLLFKQSTTCPISAKANEEFQAFVNENETTSAAMVLVIEDRYKIFLIKK